MIVVLLIAEGLTVLSTATPAPTPFVPSKCELSQAPTGIRIQDGSDARV